LIKNVAGDEVKRCLRRGKETGGRASSWGTRSSWEEERRICGGVRGTRDEDMTQASIGALHAKGKRGLGKRRRVFRLAKYKEVRDVLPETRGTKRR